MDLSKLTQKSQEAIQLAQDSAVRHGHQQVDTLHLLHALQTQEGGLVPRLLERLDVPVGVLQSSIDDALARRPRVGGGGVEAGKVYVTEALQATLVQAQDEAKRLKDEYVSVEHLLLALIETGRADEAARLLGDAGVDRNKILEALHEVRRRRSAVWTLTPGPTSIRWGSFSTNS